MSLPERDQRRSIRFAIPFASASSFADARRANSSSRERCGAGFASAFASGLAASRGASGGFAGPP